MVKKFPMPYLPALDQGTSSSRSIVFDQGGRVVAQAQREFKQIFPQPGWIEHDPLEIWQTQLATAQEALAKAGLKASDIAAMGITNQRETTVLWDRKTGQPLHNAIVWQDRRTEPLCARLREQDLIPLVRKRTGLIIDPYFSGTELAWLLEHMPGARIRAERGELAFGTIDTWLVWQLTNGQVHATDVSNASRTIMFDIRRAGWDNDLLAALNIPHALMPDVHESAHVFDRAAAEHLGAEIAIGGIASDQQAALFGPACFKPPAWPRTPMAPAASC